MNSCKKILLGSNIQGKCSVSFFVRGTAMTFSCNSTSSMRLTAPTAFVPIVVTICFSGNSRSVIFGARKIVVCWSYLVGSQPPYSKRLHSGPILSWHFSFWPYSPPALYGYSWIIFPLR